MNKCILILSTIFLINQLGFSQSFDEKTTTASKVRLNVSNLGTFGNAFRGYRDGTGDPSCEYPAGSGVEHLFESGIWIGGIVNGQALVSTSAIDASQGYSTGRSGFEFTTESGVLEERSSLFDSPFFSNNAVSHQDYVATFTDRNILVPGTQIPIQNHDNPLFVDVQMETYNWNYTFSDFFVIMNFSVINRSPNTIEDAYFSFWANTVIRNINVTPAGQGGAAFYNKGGNGYVDSLLMSYCFDHSGDPGFTDSYVGQKFLGAEDKIGFHHPSIDSAYNQQTGSFYIDDFETTYNAWQFNSSTDPVFFQPTSDAQRYIKQTSGLNESQCWLQDGSTNQSCGATSLKSQLKLAGNRSDLVSVGPFVDFAPGDTINIVYAFVLADKKDDGLPNSDDTEEQKEIFYANAEWAQTAYNGEDVNFNGILDPDEDIDGDGEITRYILPTPPDAPKTRIEAKDGSIDVYWSNNSEYSVDPITQEQDFEGYRLYLSKLGFDVVQTPPNLEYVRFGQYDLPANGYSFETGLDSITLPEPVMFDGDTTRYFYKYTIPNTLNGWQYAVAVTAFDRGNEENNLESLESAPSANSFRVFSGKRPVTDMEKNEPFVYPNPYYAGASWEGTSNFQEESRKLVFANLPAECVIRVFTVAGDLIDEFEHNGRYNGSDTRWFRTFGAEDSEDNEFSGGEHAWDLLSEESQIIARGVYLFTVEDKDSGELFKGKFLVIK
jgi:hypothetical protein